MNTWKTISRTCQWLGNSLFHLQAPLNIDAIVMKGNVVLSEYLYEARLKGYLHRYFHIEG